MNWSYNVEENCKSASSDTHQYYIGEINGKVKLWIINKKTNHEKMFGIMNHDPIFIEQEAETIIEREGDMV